MRKWIAMLLALTLCLPLSGCGKSDAVKAVEAMMKPLSTLTEETQADYFAAHEAYQALSFEEQETVKPRKKFYAQLDPYFTQNVSGDWYPFDIQPQYIESLEKPQFCVTLNADGTAQQTDPVDGVQIGSWTMEYGVVILSGIAQISTPNHGSSSWDETYPFKVDTMTGSIRLNSWDVDRYYLRLEEYNQALSEVIKIVDLSEVNLEEYFGIDEAIEREVDEFGAHTGWVYRSYFLTSKLFDEGWYCYDTDNEFTVELIAPTYDTMVTDIDSGNVTPNHHEQRTVTLNAYAPFLPKGGNSFIEKTDYMIVEGNPPAEDFRFGRAKGKVYFINADCVKEVLKDEYETRSLILDTEKYAIFGHERLNAGEWDDVYQLY